MTGRYIVDEGRVSLNGFDYRLRGPVTSTIASRFAPKQVIGETTLESHEDVSYLRWDDWTGGIGLREFYADGGPAPKRAWFSDCDLSKPGHTTLGPLVTLTTSITGTFPNTSVAGDDLPALVIFKSEVYAMVRNTVSAVDLIRVYKYNNSTDSWGTAVHEMTATGNTFTMNCDMKVGFVTGVLNLVVCNGSDYAFTTDGTSWTNDTADAHRLTIHDDALWGISRAGVFFSSTTLGTEVAKAPLPVPATAATTDISYISDLVTMPDASGEFRIHAATAFGLWTYDQTNDAWTKSNIALPEARYNGRGTDIWNGDVYVPTGTGLFRAIYGDKTQIFPIGPDSDHGLPAINRGAIVDLAPGHSQIVAILAGDFPGFRNFVTTATDMRPLVLSYNGVGWQVLWQGTTASEFGKKCIIGSAYDTYRLWFSTAVTTTARNIYYIDLPTERVEPHETQTQTFAAASYLETPIFHVGQDVEGLALSVLVEPHQTGTTETIVVKQKINGASAYTTLGTISGDADYEFLLPSTTDISGQTFRTIQYRLDFARGATTTNRPFIHSLTLKFLKFIPNRQQHNMTLDLSREIDGQSPRDQYRNIREMLRKRDLIDFTFREDDSLVGEERYFCQITGFRAVMDTGFDYGGTVELELKEVHHTVGGSWDIDNWDEFLWG